MEEKNVKRAKKAKRTDGRYQVSLSVGRDENGRQRRKYFYGKTQKEANRKKDEYLQEAKTDRVLKGRVTVEEWVKCWLEVYAKGGYQSQQMHLANAKRICAAMGEMCINEVKPLNVMQFARTVEGLSRSYVKKLRADMQNIFRTAEQNGWFCNKSWGKKKKGRQSSPFGVQ